MHNLNWSRKAYSWDEVKSDDQAIKLAVGLKVYKAEDSPCDVFDGVGKPSDPTPDARPRMFVAQRDNGDLFLVDSEGYNYARYTVRIPGLRIKPTQQASMTADGRLTTAQPDDSPAPLSPDGRYMS